MTGSASPPTGSSQATGPLVTTRRADVVQWESCFRPQDIPVPEGFEEIDSLAQEYERDPVKAEALKAARQRLAKKLATATNLAKLRLSRGWSQKRLADEIGTSQPHIARIENGRDNVLLATANQLAKALGVSLEEINAALGYGEKRA
jgi:DNA-binding XRE family transcriptional regulator